MKWLNLLESLSFEKWSPFYAYVFRMTLNKDKVIAMYEQCQSSNQYLCTYYFRFDQNYTAGILQLTPLSGKSAVLGMSEYSNTQKKVPTS